jgi:preprotein translocase subunit YajC
MNFLLLYFQGEGGGSLIWSFLPFIFIFGIFYFLVIMPQRRQQKNCS